MKRATVKLVLMVSAAYYAIILFTASLLPSDLQPPLYLLVGPLLALVLILANNLASRATLPTEVRVSNPPSRIFSREIQRLTRQIEVGAGSSTSYYQQVLVQRLREALVEKVRLETGLDKMHVRRVLQNPRLGPGLLKNDRLYRLLYSPPLAKGPSRVRVLEDAVGLIEAWKP